MGSENEAGQHSVIFTSCWADFILLSGGTLDSAMGWLILQDMEGAGKMKKECQQHGTRARTWHFPPIPLKGTGHRGSSHLSMHRVDVILDPAL